MPDHEGAAGRRRTIAAAKAGMRDLRVELALLNHRVGGRVALKDADLDCLDVLVRDGTMTPTELARRTGVHAATMTGILGRLERAGWIERRPAAGDRRAVVLSPVPDRVREVFGHYAGMSASLDEILGSYDDQQLAVIVDFLSRSTEAGRAAAEQLS